MVTGPVQDRPIIKPDDIPHRVEERQGCGVMAIADDASSATDRFYLGRDSKGAGGVSGSKKSFHECGLLHLRELKGDHSDDWPSLEKLKPPTSDIDLPSSSSTISSLGVYESTLPRSTQEWLDKMRSQKKIDMVQDVVQKLCTEGGMEAWDAIVLVSNISEQYPDYAEWVVTSLPQTVSELKREGMSSSEIRDHLTMNWPDVPIDLCEGRDVEPGKLNDIEFIVKHVNAESRKEYIETVSWLRTQGVSDKDIQAIIEKWNIRDIHAFAKSINAVGVEGLSPREIVELFDMGRERHYEVWDFETISRNLPENVSPAALKKRLGLKGYIEFCAFCSKAEKRGMLEGRSVMELFRLCEGVKNRFNIQKWSYYNPVIFDHILKPNSGKPKNLVIMAREDKDGAFHDDDLCMMTAINEGLQLEIIETGNEYEIYGRVSKFPRGSVSRMDVFGHGSKKGIRLSKMIYKDGRGQISTDDYKILWRSIGDRFVANARIGLHSCSTGKGGPDADNMVRFFADCFSPDDIPELVIEAPDRDTGSSAEVGADHRIHPRYDKAKTVIYRR